MSKVELAVGSDGKLKPLTIEQLSEQMRNKVTALRHATIPVGRAAAATTRKLSLDVPATASKMLREAKQDGSLKKRYEELAGVGTDKPTDPFDVAVALGIEIIGEVKRDLERRSVAFEQQALRDDGKATALEEQLAALRLSNAITDLASASDTPDAAEGDAEASAG